MFSFARVVSLLQHSVHLHIAVSIRLQHDSDHLLARPKLNWFQDGGGGQFDSFIAIVEITAHLHYFRSVKEPVLLGQQERSRQEVLSGRDQGGAILRHADVLCYVHEGAGFGSCLLGLRHMDVHFITVEIGVVRCAHTFVEPQSTVLHYASSVRHD